MDELHASLYHMRKAHRRLVARLVLQCRALWRADGRHEQLKMFRKLWIRSKHPRREVTP